MIVANIAINLCVKVESIAKKGKKMMNDPYAREVEKIHN